MAPTTNHLRDLLEKIKGDAQRALALLPSETELRYLGWKCTACGHVKHFTRPATAAVADRCPKCKGDSICAPITQRASAERDMICSRTLFLMSVVRSLSSVSLAPRNLNEGGLCEGG